MLFLCVFCLYLGSLRVPGYNDPVWNTATAESLALQGTADISAYLPALKEQFSNYERWIRVDGDRVYAKYTLLTPLCAAPLYWAAFLGGMPVDSWAVPYIGKLVAALFSALSAVFLFKALSLLVERRIALVAALAYALCTSTFSVSSQALFQHGVSQFFLALAFYLLLKSRENRKILFHLGMVMALAVWSRPLNVAGMAVLFVFIVFRYRRAALLILPGSLVVALVACGANLLFCGQLIPQGYGEEAFQWDAPFFEGLAIWLVSPGRGLFFYTPLFLFSLLGGVLAFRRQGAWELRAAGLAAAITLVVGAKWHSMGGGFSYRLLVDLSVYLGLLLAPALVFMRGRAMLSGLFWLLAACSLVVQVAGVSTYFTGPSTPWDLSGGRLHCAFKTRPKLFDILYDMQTADQEASFPRLRSWAERANGVLGYALSALWPKPLPEGAGLFCRAEPIGQKSRVLLPNVILISIDSLRAGHLSCYGYPRQTSPNLDALAASGVLFEEAVTQAPWTLPAHVSLLTSTYPITHGVDRTKRRMARDTQTLAMWLKDRGYYTGAVVSGPYMKKLYGFDRGFLEYDEELAVVENPHSVITSPRIEEKAAAFVERWENRPFFLFLHYWDVHYDYNPPPPFDRLFDPDYAGTLDASDYENNASVNAGMDPRDKEHLVALYDGEIRFVDQAIGGLIGLLKEKGLLDDTLLVITGDHGDEFFEHGEKGHSHSLYQELLHVPLIMRYPKLGSDRRIKRPVGLIDIAPTVLDILGFLPSQLDLDGRSLTGLLKDPASWRDRPIWSETRRARKSKSGPPGRPALSMRLGNFKCIHYEAQDTRPSLDEYYELDADPLEREAVPEDERLARGFPAFPRMMKQWVAKHQRTVKEEQEAPVDPETLRSLKELGY